MSTYLCKEITADIVGAYLGIYRATCAFRREYEPPRLARELIQALNQRGRETLELSPPRSKTALGQSVQSLFLVNSEVLVLVVKLARLRLQEQAALEKLLNQPTWRVGLALNFGSRAPEFWRTQRSPMLEKGRQT
jgi:hypothetical protein